MVQRIPLLNDHHSHPAVYAAMADGVQLGAVTDTTEAMAQIRRSAKTVKDEIAVAFGWNSALFAFDQHQLAALPAAVICNLSFHEFLITPAARERLQEKHPDIIARIDDHDWVEHNINRMMRFIVDLCGLSDDTLRRFYDQTLAPLGVYRAEEMLLPNREVIASYQRIGYADRTRIWADLQTWYTLDSDDRAAVHGLKLFTDGAVGARSAAVSDYYLGSANDGQLLYNDAELLTTLDKLATEGKPIAIHAIGDRAIEQVLVAIESLTADGLMLPPIRLEHVQFINEGQARRARNLAIALSMQPNFNSDSTHYRDRLSKRLLEANNPLRMLIDDVGYRPGDDLLFGSDGMPHGVDYAINQSLFPKVAGQRLSLDEFVAGYCLVDPTVGEIELSIDQSAQRVCCRLRSA
ncbi:amidohydrolase family protein [Gammaproteobacteria bacterium]|nr:amidohydrolase family protein [Gammaproteobacteria bacterium]